jgi:hypothetical protein
MNGPGRPTLYREQHAERAHDYCLLGATNDELAGFFHVSASTVDNWLAQHPDFARAVRDGRAAADATIARRLFQRATGYDYAAEKLVVRGGEAVKVEHRVHVPPDVGACIFWLRNRRRHDWMERARPEPARVRLDVEALERASERARRMSRLMAGGESSREAGREVDGAADRETGGGQSCQARPGDSRP